MMVPVTMPEGKVTNWMSATVRVSSDARKVVFRRLDSVEIDVDPARQVEVTRKGTTIKLVDADLDKSTIIGIGQKVLLDGEGNWGIYPS